ncbi:MAG: phosphoribosylaminoimidazolesuccinocarboxamide synthase [Myxococcales bacterium]
MPTLDDLRAQLSHALRETSFPSLGILSRGKVRDNYRLPDGKRLAMVTTDRLSAFDHVLTTLPFKGEVLSRLAVFWFGKTADVFPNHLIDVPDPNVLICRACRPLPIEVVVRGHLAGSLWRDYTAGRANAAYGLSLPPGLRRDQRFERALVTPTTKAEGGQHDLPISEAELVGRGLVARPVWEQAVSAARALFARGQEWALSRGLILADTKYEFGLDGGELLLIDEIHTPDSSRYWIADGYERRFAGGEDQQMLDKENLRQWLIRERNFSGQGPLPQIPDEVRVDLAQKYLAAYERITGARFESAAGEVAPRIESNLRARGYL